MLNTRISRKTRIAAALSLAVAAASANAVPFYWTDWTGGDLDSGAGFQAQGTITTLSSSVTVTYTNANGIGFYHSSPSTDYYTGGSGPTSPYTSALVDNRPTGTDIIALSQAGTQTLEFSETIANPVFAFVSLNGNGYAFDQDFEILSLGGVDGNACGYWGCGNATKDIVEVAPGIFEYQLNSTGGEPHGTLRFTGTFDTVSWRSRSNEYWNGFTVGVQGTAVEVCDSNPTLPECNNNNPPAVPEPGMLGLLGLGFAGVAFRRRVRQPG